MRLHQSTKTLKSLKLVQESAYYRQNMNFDTITWQSPKNSVFSPLIKENSQNFKTKQINNSNGNFYFFFFVAQKLWFKQSKIDPFRYSRTTTLILNSNLSCGLHLYTNILGLSPLIRAVKNRNLGMVQLLIEKKAKITTTDQVKFYR